MDEHKTKDGKIVLFKNFDEKRADYDGELQAEVIPDAMLLLLFLM